MWRMSMFSKVAGEQQVFLTLDLLLLPDPLAADFDLMCMRDWRREWSLRG